MAFKRKDRDGCWYMDRDLPGFGRVKKSLDTRSKGVASQREALIISLAQQGQSNALKAFIDGRVHIQTLMAAMASGTLASSTFEADGATVGSAIPAVLAAKSGDVKAGTLARYKEGLAHFERVVGEDTLVSKALRKKVIQEFKATMLDQGMVRDTVNNYLIAISVLCTYAVDEGWIHERPKIKKLKTSPRRRFLEARDRERYLEALPKDLHTLMKLLMWTGMRLGEAEALRVMDLSLHESPLASIREDKSSRGRTVHLPRDLADLLLAHIGVFANADDKVFDFARRTVQKAHSLACIKAGIPDYRIHDHRHTAAVALARSGMPLGVLMNHLGHQTMSMTMRYADFAPEYQDVGRYYERVQEQLDK